MSSYLVRESEVDEMREGVGASVATTSITSFIHTRILKNAIPSLLLFSTSLGVTGSHCVNYTIIPQSRLHTTTITQVGLPAPVKLCGSTGTTETVAHWPLAGPLIQHMPTAHAIMGDEYTVSDLICRLKRIQSESQSQDVST